MEVSYLYTPALKLDSVVAHSPDLDTDAIVVDLEDSTHPKAKGRAREKVAGFDFEPLRAVGVRLGLRVNSLACFDGLEDLLMLRTLCERGVCPFTYVLLPKVNCGRDVETYRRLFSVLPAPPKLFTFIETVSAVDHVDEIAEASDALCFGQADLVSEMYSPNEAFVNYARARMCIAAAQRRIQAIDTNSFDIRDMVSFEQECMLARSYGFTGKAAIHPDQVAAINKVFRVSTETLVRYEAIINEYNSGDNGFAIHDGEVIAPPFIAKARRMLELYR